MEIYNFGTIPRKSRNKQRMNIGTHKRSEVAIDGQKFCCDFWPSETFQNPTTDMSEGVQAISRHIGQDFFAVLRPSQLSSMFFNVNQHPKVRYAQKPYPGGRWSAVIMYAQRYDGPLLPWKGHRVPWMADLELLFCITLQRKTHWFSLEKRRMTRFRDLPFMAPCGGFGWPPRIHINWFPGGKHRTGPFRPTHSRNWLEPCSFPIEIPTNDQMVSEIGSFSGRYLRKRFRYSLGCP